MENLFLNQIRKHASSFLQEKFKIARIAFTDTTPAELLAEEATNSTIGGPDAMTMTRLAMASFDVDNYWRIVDVLHGRFYALDWKQWRQSYKSMVLLEFLLTHGAKEFADEFRCDLDAIVELGNFVFIDENGFDWGLNMKKRSERIIDLLAGGETLKDVRLKALKITREIQGFGNIPSSSNSPTSTLEDPNDSNKTEKQRSEKDIARSTFKECILTKDNGKQLSFFLENEDFLEEDDESDDCPDEETELLLDSEYEDYRNEKSYGFLSGLRSKFASLSPIIRFPEGKVTLMRSVSDVGRYDANKKLNRQSSLGY